jgi:hypothetical protein
MEFKIEKNIEPPKRHKYPFANMAIGDSFKFRLEHLLRIRNAASLYGKRTNKKFTVQRYIDSGRCWRIK